MCFRRFLLQATEAGHQEANGKAWLSAQGCIALIRSSTHAISHDRLNHMQSTPQPVVGQSHNRIKKHLLGTVLIRMYAGRFLFEAPCYA